jgi:hypothetical protein
MGRKDNKEEMNLFKNKSYDEMSKIVALKRTPNKEVTVCNLILNAISESDKTVYSKYK